MFSVRLKWPWLIYISSKCLNINTAKRGRLKFVSSPEYHKRVHKNSHSTNWSLKLSKHQKYRSQARAAPKSSSFPPFLSSKPKILRFFYTINDICSLLFSNFFPPNPNPSSSINSSKTCCPNLSAQIWVLSLLSYSYII